jgi:DNA end-binding protein Ku
MHWPDEIRSPDELTPKPVDVEDHEIDAAVELIQTMSEEDLPRYTDHYR